MARKKEKVGSGHIQARGLGEAGQQFLKGETSWAVRIHKEEGKGLPRANFFGEKGNRILNLRLQGHSLSNQSNGLGGGEMERKEKRKRDTTRGDIEKKYSPS